MCFGFMTCCLHYLYINIHFMYLHTYLFLCKNIIQRPLVPFLQIVITVFSKLLEVGSQVR